MCLAVGTLQTSCSDPKNGTGMLKWSQQLVYDLKISTEAETPLVAISLHKDT